MSFCTLERSQRVWTRWFQTQPCWGHKSLYSCHSICYQGKRASQLGIPVIVNCLIYFPKFQKVLTDNSVKAFQRLMRSWSVRQNLLSHNVVVETIEF